MIIYSVTIIIEDSIVDEWELWMKKKHIPDIMNTQLFTNYSFLKDLNSHNKYIIQYELDSIQNYMQYTQLFALKLQNEHAEKFGKNYKAWRSLLTKKNFN
tara:strand:+ start:77 stop:376 length:300 start_codon:yes stop_codon:yes gene_type:complete